MTAPVARVLADVARAFDSTPASYGVGGDFHARYAADLVARAGLRPGNRVLDVATGTAPAAIAAAERVAPDGSVIGIDISPGMLAHARRNVAARGHGSIQVLQGSGADLPFADETFDAVLCASSLVWFSDIPAALREWARVLKPGGTVAFSTLAVSAGPLGRMLRDHLAGFDVDFPDLNTPLDTPEKCRRTVSAAGFTPAEVTFGTYGGAFDDAAAAWDAIGGQLVAAAERVHDWETLRADPPMLWAAVRRGEPIPVPLSEGQLRQLRQDILAGLAALVTDHSIPNPTVAIFVRAVRDPLGR